MRFMGAMAAKALGRPVGVRLPGDVAGQHLAQDEAGADAVDPHPVAGVVQGQGAGQQHLPALGGAVGGQVGVAQQAADRGDVEDRAASPAHHAGQHRPAGQHDPLQVHVQHPVPVRLVDLRHPVRGGGGADAAVVHQHVQALPKRPSSSCTIASTSPADGHVGSHQDPFGALAPHQLQGAGGALRVAAVVDAHPGPLAGEGHGDRPADPRPRARDQGRLVRQALLRHHARFSAFLRPKKARRPRRMFSCPTT